jgi:hypothetical protein
VRTLDDGHLQQPKLDQIMNAERERFICISLQSFDHSDEVA